METLRPILTGSTNTESQRNAIQMLSRGAFGRMVINPTSFRVNGGVDEAFVYEGDELRGGPKGRLHRAIVKRKGTVRHAFVVMLTGSLNHVLSRHTRSLKYICSGTLTYLQNAPSKLMYPNFKNLM